MRFFAKHQVKLVDTLKESMTLILWTRKVPFQSRYLEKRFENVTGLCNTFVYSTNREHEHAILLRALTKGVLSFMPSNPQRRTEVQNGVEKDKL